MANERSLADGAARVPAPPPVPLGPASTRATRERLLDAALDLFSRQGFAGTSIRDLARAVGIRESSVYKHFASKQGILDALVERADVRMAEVGQRLGVGTGEGAEAAEDYRDVGEEELVAIGRGMLAAVLHDPELAGLRRLLALERYRDPAAAARYREYFLTRPMTFHTDLFAWLLAGGGFRPGLAPEDVALAFFGPVHLLMDLADEDEAQAFTLMERHVRHFRATHLVAPGPVPDCVPAPAPETRP